MRDSAHKPNRGLPLLLEHVAGIEPPQRPELPAFERLCGAIGPELAGMLVRALAVGQGRRRHELVA